MVENLFSYTGLKYFSDTHVIYKFFKSEVIFQGQKQKSLNFNLRFLNSKKKNLHVTFEQTSIKNYFKIELKHNRSLLYQAITFQH